MTTCNGSLYTCCSSSHSSVDAAGSLFPKPSSLIPNRKSSAAQFRPNLPLLSVSRAPARLVLVKAAAASGGKSGNLDGKREAEVVEEEEEVEEELPWIQEKALDLVEFTGSVTQALPGPRVGQSSLPWILAVPMAYLGVTFVIAVVKTVKKFNSPREKRRKLVNKNATVCISLDELFEKGTSEVNESALKELMQKTGFDIREILRKYIRYVLNEKPFNPDLIANLIHLRKETQLDDSEVAGILNEISGRIVKDKGPVVMDMSGYSEKGFKRKLAVQTLFGKIYYLSELPDFCSRDSALNIKTTFGVTDEDAEKLRLHTVSEVGDMDSLEKMIGGSKEEEDKEEESRDDSAKAS